MICFNERCLNGAWFLANLHQLVTKQTLLHTCTLIKNVSTDSWRLLAILLVGYANIIVEACGMPEKYHILFSSYKNFKRLRSNRVKHNKSFGEIKNVWGSSFSCTLRYMKLEKKSLCYFYAFHKAGSNLTWQQGQKNHFYRYVKTYLIIILLPKHKEINPNLHVFYTNHKLKWTMLSVKVTHWQIEAHRVERDDETHMEVLLWIQTHLFHIET